MDKKNNGQKEVNFLEKISDGVIGWVGSIQSLIAHTLLFATCFLLPVFDIVPMDKMLLVLTTVLSIEAIYMAIFIQMAVNKSNERIEEIGEDIEEISEDIEDIQEDIEEISEDIEEINEDIEDIQEDIEEINDDDDDDDHNEKARNVMLKSKVNNNQSEIKSLKEKINDLQNKLNGLKDSDL